MDGAALQNEAAMKTVPAAIPAMYSRSSAISFSSASMRCDGVGFLLAGWFMAFALAFVASVLASAWRRGASAAFAAFASARLARLVWAAAHAVCSVCAVWSWSRADHGP